MSVAGKRRPGQLIGGFSMGERWLLKGMGHGVLSSLRFNDNSGVHYFDRAWLREAADIMGGKRGNLK
jgi:hypothetical protein